MCVVCLQSVRYTTDGLYKEEKPETLPDCNNNSVPDEVAEQQPEFSASHAEEPQDDINNLLELASSCELSSVSPEPGAPSQAPTTDDEEDAMTTDEQEKLLAYYGNM